MLDKADAEKLKGRTIREVEVHNQDAFDLHLDDGSTLRVWVDGESGEGFAHIAEPNIPLNKKA